MSVRRRLSLLAAFVLSGAGALLLLIWIYYLLGWIPTSGHLFGFPPNLLVLGLIPGAGIGLLVWSGFVIGRRRAMRSSGPHSRGVYLRAVGSSLLIFLALGTLTGVVITVPRALAQTAFTAQSGQGAPLNEVIAYILLYGSLAALPLVNGLLTGSRTQTGAVAAFLGGTALAIGGSIAYFLPVSLLILLVHGPIPACARTNPPYCGLMYFSPAVEAEILDLVGVWVAVTVGITASAAAFVGTFVLGLTNGA
jgi:hypothetical protein